MQLVAMTRCVGTRDNAREVRSGSPNSPLEQMGPIGSVSVSSSRVCCPRGSQRRHSFNNRACRTSGNHSGFAQPPAPEAGRADGTRKTRLVAALRPSLEKPKVGGPVPEGTRCGRTRRPRPANPTGSPGDAFHPTRRCFQPSGKHPRRLQITCERHVAPMPWNSAKRGGECHHR